MRNTPLHRASAVVVAASASLVVLGPLAAVAAAAFTAPEQFARHGLGVPLPPTLGNYAVLFSDPATLASPLLTTAGVTVLVAASQTLSSVLAAYAFAFLRFPARRALFAAYLLGYFAPPVVTVIPLYFVFARAGLTGTFLALALPFALASPYAVLLLRHSFAAVPRELINAATLDGANHGQVLRLVALPLARPAVVTVALVAGVSTWNSFLWPRLVAGIQLPQVQVAVASLQTQYSDNWTVVMAASLVALLPPLIATALAQRAIIQTVTQRDATP
jgi:multiple sugar transport system permease protein